MMCIIYTVKGETLMTVCSLAYGSIQHTSFRFAPTKICKEDSDLRLRSEFRGVGVCILYLYLPTTCRPLYINDYITKTAKKERIRRANE